MRHFHTPSGRRWTVRLCRISHYSAGSISSIVVSGWVLRFTSENDVTFDLDSWPSDWPWQDDEALTELLRRAALTAPRPGWDELRDPSGLVSEPAAVLR